MVTSPVISTARHTKTKPARAHAAQLKKQTIEVAVNKLLESLGYLWKNPPFFQAI